MNTLTDDIQTLFRRHPHIRGMVGRPAFAHMIGTALDQAAITDPDLSEAIDAVRDGHIVYAEDHGWMHADEASQCDGCQRHFAETDHDGLCEDCGAAADHDGEAAAGERRIYERSLI